MKVSDILVGFVVICSVEDVPGLEVIATLSISMAVESWLPLMALASETTRRGKSPCSSVWAKLERAILGSCSMLEAHW